MPDEHQDTQEAHEPQQDHQGSDVAALSREAAQRVDTLRKVEAERDALRERVDDFDRAEVDRRAREELHDPADLFSVTSLRGGRDVQRVA